MHFRDKVNDKAVKELPETSIVIKTQDKSSEGMKTIAKNAADLGSKLRELQDKAHSLSKEKATLNANFDKAKKELTEAKKKFNETQDAMDGLKMEAAQANFDNLSYQFRSVSKEAEKARKEIENLDTKANKSMNSSGGIGGGFKSITNALVTMQAAQMIGGAVQGSLNTKIGSALGSDSGTLASSMISSVLSGAITGSAFGPLGVLAGATVGGITGAISGSAQRYESQDSSFKSYVQDAVQEQLDAQSESLTSGSSIAAGRETDKISFATLFGSKETADSYLTNLVGMANSTPFLYDDLTSMSKTLATYGYDADSILPVLQTIGDAGAALGQSTIECLLPSQDYPFNQAGTILDPGYYLEPLRYWAAEKIPVRYIVTESDINALVYIESVTEKEQDGTGDVYCTIALREYVDLEAQEVATLNTTRYTGNSGRKSDAAKDITYHRVVSGDTLSMLCRRTYGDGTASYYNALAKYNGISNPHLIYVGQTIKLPPKDILLGGG